MTNPTGGWLRLWYCNEDPQTKNRRVVDQFVRMAATSNGRWQFVVGRRISSRLFLREGGKRFKCPAVPGARRNRGKPWRLWRRKVTRNNAPPRCALHIDDLLRGGALNPGEPRFGEWIGRMGDGTFRLKFASDMWNPNNAKLWLYFMVDDGSAWRSVRQEVQLAIGGGKWWFLENGRIYAELVLRDGLFRAPGTARRPAKSSRHWPQQENPESVHQRAGNPRAFLARQSIAVRKKLATPARKDWLMSKISRTKRAAARFIAPPRARSQRKPHILARARTSLKQIVKPWHIVTDLAKQLTVFVCKQIARLANSYISLISTNLPWQRK